MFLYDLTNRFISFSLSFCLSEKLLKNNNKKQKTKKGSFNSLRKTFEFIRAFDFFFFFLYKSVPH